MKLSDKSLSNVQNQKIDAIEENGIWTPMVGGMVADYYSGKRGFSTKALALAKANDLRKIAVEQMATLQRELER